MSGTCDGSLCFEDLQLSQFSPSFQYEGSSQKIFFRKIKGEPRVIKKLPLNCNDIVHEHQHWKKLIKLRDDHLVRYHQCLIHQDARYLIMESCQGSMLDYCNGNLEDSVASHIKAIDITWQITCGLDYLYRHKIDYGDLKLENVLFWRKNSKSKRIVVKIAGYGYETHQDDIKPQLAILYYAAATKEKVVPNGTICLGNLTEIDVEHRTLALDLITLLTKANLSNLEVASLLRHPFFIRCSEESRSRLTRELHVDEEMCRVLNNKEKIEEWENSLDNSKFSHEDFEDFKDIMLPDNNDVIKVVGEAFKTTPTLFAEYIWHVVTSFRVNKSHSQHHSIEIGEFLGKGHYGQVFKCNYTDGSGRTYLAACKKCSPTPDAVDVFNREVQTLRQLNHLFVVKYLDLVEKESKKFIVMELCEGSLNDYVEGKLERIPKDSLDDKTLISQVALGVAYIHGEEIIHKDLKLANILLWCHSSTPSLVLAKIADFGFAKELKPDQSEFSDTTHPGTENYMAPELLNAKGGFYPASFASDVYAFGIIISRIVKKGDHPFGSKNIWRIASMAEALVPQNLQDLSWDLKDLILKLTDSVPSKRPKMALILRHPYFMLTNDRTKRYFVDQLWDDLGSPSQDDGIEQLKKIFSNKSFTEWFRDLSDEKQYTTEDIEIMAETLQYFRKLKPDVVADTLYPEKEYAQDIKKAITSEYDVTVGSQIDQMNSIHGPSRYGLYKLFQRSPKLLVPYFWSHLHEVILPKPLASSINNKKTNERLSSKTKPTKRMNHPIISEIEWSSLFCEEKIIEELWNIKYSAQYNKSLETEREIIGLVAKCCMTERVWSVILEQLGTAYAPSLLCKIVQNSGANAPNMTQMFLERYGTYKEQSLPMYWAACNEGERTAEIMQVLLDYGVNPNAENPMGISPIDRAASNESPSTPKVIKVLLKGGANQYARSALDNFMAIHRAVLNQGDYASEIVQQLLVCEDVPIEKELFECLKLAVLNVGESALALVNLLLERKGNEIVHDNKGLSLAHFTAINDGIHGPNIMKVILENGVKANSGDKNQRTPLHFAVMKKSTQSLGIIKVLLENSADPNAFDIFGQTPVYYAATNEGEHANETLKLLLSKGGCIKSRRTEGLTPFHCVLINSGICGAEMRELIGADKESANVRLNKNEETLLHRFVDAKNARLDIVQSILNYGGNPNMQDKFGRSPVHTAVENPTDVGLTILQLLLQNGGNPNLTDEEQNFTPVHYVAATAGEKAIDQMTILLGSNGDANAGGKDKITPLHLAVVNVGIHASSLVRILLNHRGNPNAASDVNRHTPLHLAITNENDQIRWEMISMLLEKDGNPNAGDINGRTPVHNVVCEKRENSLKVLKLLVEKGGNIFRGDNKKMTPFLLATRSGSNENCLPEIKNYLVNNTNTKKLLEPGLTRSINNNFKTYHIFTISVYAALILIRIVFKRIL